MKKLSPQFLFEADAGTVYSFITDLQETRPDLFKNTSGEFSYTCWLAEGVRRDALYSIALEVSIWSTRRTDDVLVRNKYVAEIALTQEKAGECVGSLYIETDPQAWYRPEDSPWRHLEELEEPWSIPMNMGTRFVIALWRGLVAEWQEQQKKTISKEIQPAKKKRGAPRLEDRPDADEKRGKARKYLERVKKGTSKEIAARLVGHDRKTLERWVKRLL